MNQRIAELRKESGMSQAELAKKLKLSRNFISLLETGERIPSDRTVRDICNVFGVNEEWLLTGNGEKLVMPPDHNRGTYTAVIAAGGDDLIAEIVETYMELDADSKKAIKKFIDQLSEKRMKRK